MKDIEQLIEWYSVAKQEMAKAKEEVDSLNKSIKAELEHDGIDEYKGKEFTVSRTEINSDKLDEQAMMNLLKESYPEVAEKVIQKVEVLDIDKLEDMVYNRIIEADVVSSCIVHRAPTIRLNIRKNKEEDKDA